LGAKRCGIDAATPRLARKKLRGRHNVKRFIGLTIAGLMLVAGFLAITGIPSIAGGSGASQAAAATTTQQIGMKVLLINDNSDGGIAAGDWVNTLKREGVPYEELNTNSSTPGSVALPALSSTASDGTQVANYEGVVVALSGNSGLSDAQWTTLQTFEHDFSVRQVTAYAVLDPTRPAANNFGLTFTNPVGTFSGNTEAPTLTSDGAKVFPYLNKVDLDAQTFGDKGTAGAGDTTLISGSDGSSLVGIYTSSDGRQTMYQTFNENQYMLQSELLRHGELDWLTRNTYFGDQRNYMETHIDDNFLSDDSYTPGAGGIVGGGATDYNAADALREVPADVTKAATWSANNHFRIDMLYNGGGSVQYIADHGSDPLLTAFQAAKTDFGWINHTYDHPNLDQGCSNATYLAGEITQNTSWATGTLGLTPSADPTKSLGVENPGELVTGEHSGLANLLPGNPGTVDPPEFNTPTTSGTTGLPAGTYTYAITDQFSATGGESTASTTQVVVPAPVAPATGTTVNIKWDAVCHASDYNVYRQNPGSTAWVKLNTTPIAATSTDFGNTGPTELTFPDTGAAGTAATLPTANNASESAYEQNTVLGGPTGVLATTHITDFGSDASKPYPNPATATFTTGAPPTTQYPVGSTFQDGGATAIPRYPTNIYYNAATTAQEVNEYETLYDLPTCKPIAGVTTCNNANTPFTMTDIVNSIDFGNPGMFSHLMGNDPRPHYFHQTNMMSQTTGGPTAQGDGLYYQVMDPLLAQYNAYFASNSPIEQLTMQAIGTLLSEQAAWATAGGSQVTGSIKGNVVTVNNAGAAMQIPLTGMTDVGTPYAGTVSGWTNAPSGLSTHTASTPWPAIPTTLAAPDGSSGATPTKGAPVTNKAPAPIIPPGGTTTTPPKKSVVSKPIAYVAVQVKPKTVSISKNGKVTVSLECKATKGKTAKNQLCAGSFTLKIAGHKLGHRFRFRSPKTHRFTVTLSTKVLASATRTRRHHRRRMVGSLLISTTQAHAKARLTRGTLTIRV
jgi:hypothetical protein